MGVKVIHVVLGKANPERLNGVNKVVNSLANAQASIGCDVTVWGITRSLERNFGERSYQTILIKDRGKFKLDDSLGKLIRKVNPGTLFHLHGGFIPQFYLVARKLVQAGFQYVYTPHGAYNVVALERSYLKKRIYILLFEKYLVRHAKKIHFIGSSEVIGATSRFGKVNYTVVPNGQDAAKAIVHREGDATELIFGFLGRLDIKTKGLDILIHGFDRFLKQSGVAAKLWILGDGPDREKLIDLIDRLALNDQVVFRGPVFGTVKNQLLAKMTFLCLTSRNEGMPGVVLEAIAEGTPCIVSHETNMVPYLKKFDAGICMAENTAKELAEKMDIAKNTWRVGKYDQLQQNGHIMIRDFFSWKQIAQRHLEYYGS